MSKSLLSRKTGDRMNSRCREHFPELNPLLIPLSKVCNACGAIETLSKNDATWPSHFFWQHAQKHPRLSFAAFAIPTVMMVAVVGIVTAINIGNRHLTNPPRLAQTTRTLKREPRRPLPSFSQPQQNDLSASSGFTRSAPLQPPTETDDIPQARQNAAIESRIPTSASPAPSTPPITSDVEAPDHNPPQTKNLEKRITKAISARAVYGVSVSFTNNVVNLEGTVKTDNQKAAAEQAARKIIGARELKNSISVEWSQENG